MVLYYLWLILEEREFIFILEQSTWALKEEKKPFNQAEISVVSC